MDRTRKARIADVAREANVSKTAVSFAFNSPERLSPATVSRIREAAESVGYRPRSGTVGSRPDRPSMSVGLLMPRSLATLFEGRFFGTFFGGVAEILEQAGFSLLLVSPHRGSLARALARASVDGFVVVGLSEEHPEVEAVRRSSMPMVLVDSDAFPEHGSVQSSDEVGARGAARHLLMLGHRDFLVVASEPPAIDDVADSSPGPSEAVASARLRGYRQALTTSSVPLTDERIVVGPATVEGGMAAFQRVWEDGLRPTAVLAMNDAMAVGVIWAAREIGLGVPSDLSVVGFDDLDLARLSNPPLTTVHDPVREKGEAAARLLLRMISSDAERPQHKVLETRLILRASTARVATSRSRGGGAGA